MRLVVTELFKCNPQIPMADKLEIDPSLLEQSALERDHRRIIYRGGRKARRCAFDFIQQSFFDEPVGADQESVAGERRQQLIRRIAVAGRSERQRLPPALSCFSEFIDPLHRTRPQVANPVR
jgi:hypothetical protein